MLCTDMHDKWPQTHLRLDLILEQFAGNLWVDKEQLHYFFIIHTEPAINTLSPYAFLNRAHD